MKTRDSFGQQIKWLLQSNSSIVNMKLVHKKRDLTST